MSVDIVRAMYPSMDPATATAIARVQFETAAVNFMVSNLLVCHPPPPPTHPLPPTHCSLLQLCRALRPRALWGFYGFPGNYYSPCVNISSPTPQCGYHHPSIGPTLRAQNDRVVAIVAASSALYVPGAFANRKYVTLHSATPASTSMRA